MTLPRFDFSPPPDDSPAFAPFPHHHHPHHHHHEPLEFEHHHAPFDPTQVFAPSSFGDKHSPPTSVSETSGSRPSTLNGSVESPPTSEDEDASPAAMRAEERARAELKLSGHPYFPPTHSSSNGPGRPAMPNGYHWNPPDSGASSATASSGVQKAAAWGLMSPLNISVSGPASSGVFSSPTERQDSGGTSPSTLGSPDSVQEITIPSTFPLSNSGRVGGGGGGSSSGNNMHSTPDASGSGSGKHRPSSLLLPMDTPNASRHQSPVEGKPSWPFIGSDGSRVDLSNLVSPAPIPHTPSAIHPSYGHSPLSAVELHDGPPAPLPGPSSYVGRVAAVRVGHVGTSSVDVPAHLLDVAASPKVGTGGLTGGSKSSYNAGKDDRRHFYRPSEGTHSLLSSRGRMFPSAYLTMFGRHFRADSPGAWLVYYFAFNLGLTLFNKAVMNKFKFGWTVTALHALSGTIGTRILLYRGAFKPAELGPRENWILTAFSTLYTVNIAISNVSLEMVSVPFHQVVRATTPLFTIILSSAFLARSYSPRTYVSLVPVIAGVAFATWGDYTCTALGFWLTLLGAVLAALKTVTTNVVQVGRLKLHPLDLLMRMSPLAFVQSVAYAWWTGEIEAVRAYGATKMTSGFPMVLVLNGAIAFGLNIVSFTANKKTSALTMTIAANVKQVLTIVLAVLLFNTQVNALNLFGISLTIVGGAFYAHVELTEKARKARATSSPLAQKQAI